MIWAVYHHGISHKSAIRRGRWVARVRYRAWRTAIPRVAWTNGTMAVPRRGVSRALWCRPRVRARGRQLLTLRSRSVGNSPSAKCPALASIIYGLTTERAALNGGARGGARMRTLIAGIGALGGTIATRAVSAGVPVRLATRTAESASLLRSSGLRVPGIGGAAVASGIQVAALEEYRGESFDLVVLATKAHDALKSAPFLSSLLSPGGTLLCIQNGGVSQILSARLGSSVVLGGVSNLGATMVEPGIYEQRNAGHLLIGELASGLSDRAANVARTLSPAIETRVTANMRGAVWAKLLLNCSVTTLGAIAARTMREYIASSTGKEVFRRTYDEALS